MILGSSNKYDVISYSKFLIYNPDNIKIITNFDPKIFLHLLECNPSILRFRFTDYQYHMGLYITSLDAMNNSSTIILNYRVTSTKDFTYSDVYAKISLKNIIKFDNIFTKFVDIYTSGDRLFLRSELPGADSICHSVPACVIKEIDSMTVKHHTLFRILLTLYNMFPDAEVELGVATHPSSKILSLSVTTKYCITSFHIYSICDQSENDDVLLILTDEE